MNIHQNRSKKRFFRVSPISMRIKLFIFFSTSDKFFLVSCYAPLAKIHLALNEIEEASNYAEKMNTMSNELNVSSFITEGQIISAELELKKGNIEAAIKMGESILAGLDKNSDNELKLNLYDLLYKIYQADNNPKKSLEMYQEYSIYKDSVQLERNKLTLIREVVKIEFDDLLLKNEQKIQKEKADAELKHQQKTYGIILGSIILIMGFLFYFNINIKKNRKKRDELFQEIEKLKSNDGQKLVLNSNEFQLVREKIEKSIDKSLNETDWNVLNILLKEPDITNKEIAEMAILVNRAFTLLTIIFPQRNKIYNCPI
jgi:hypothetical protein